MFHVRARPYKTSHCKFGPRVSKGMDEKKPDPRSLADKLRQMRQLHDLLKTPPELRAAQEQGFWWFICLCSPQMNAWEDDPAGWATTLQMWNEEAQAHFESTAWMFKLPWKQGTDVRQN